MKTDSELRAFLLEHLESALAIAEELSESTVSYMIETTLDQARSTDVDRLFRKDQGS